MKLCVLNILLHGPAAEIFIFQGSFSTNDPITALIDMDPTPDILCHSVVIYYRINVQAVKQVVL